MISVREGGSPDLVRQGEARHKLFVEGSKGDVVDAEAMKILLPMIDIEVMGPSFHLKSVAKAIHPHHGDYYFLIDRDHHDDETVEGSWANFPDASKFNLLIWRKREIENYFLNPDYLQKSQYLKKKFQGLPGRSLLEQKILDFANKRLLLDVVNRVILTIREVQKRTWIETFTNPDDFPDTSSAKYRLAHMEEFRHRKQDVARAVKKTAIEDLFDSFLEEFSGGNTPLIFDKGTWLDRISGKKILHQMVHHCFKVKGSENQDLQGDEKYIEVVKDLVRVDIHEQPDDFQRLRELIMARISTRP